MDNEKVNFGTESVDVIKEALSAIHDIPIIRQKLLYVLDRLKGGTTVNVLDDAIFDETIEWILHDIIKLVNDHQLTNTPSMCLNCPYESLGMCYYDKDRVKNCSKMHECPKTNI